MERKRKVSYFYDSELGDFYYGPHHPMKPHRVRMAHDLIVRYGLYSHLQVFQPVPAQLDDMAAFHNREYLEYLTVADRGKFPGQSRLAGNQDKLKERFNLGADCPVFEHIFRYCQAYTGASIGAAVQLNYQQAEIAINWSGGLHHARKSKASGFCYVNDIVLAILELLKYHQRVLYLDIDIHHGDGVEEAFLTTDRVMTVSFHKYGDDFFPGTGDLDEVGEGNGRYYSVNVPLKDGMDDESFEYCFKPIMREVMERFRPEAVVLQSGADSLAGDRLGKFNLTIKGHAACHKFMMSFGVPLLVLGGGGYKIKNVARCWAYETAVLLGEEGNMSPELPPNEYYELFKPEYSLHIQPVPDLANANSRKQLDQIKQVILERLRHVRPVNASQPLEQGVNGRQVLSDVTLQQVVPGVRDMQMLQQRATGAEFVADNMQPA